MAVFTVNVSFSGAKALEVDQSAQEEKISREEFVQKAIDVYLRQKALEHREHEETEKQAAFERLMNFPRAKLPADFDYKKELAEARDERFNRY
ncbi:MAG: hypothetical protein LBU70_01615 [Chitinispirillales bacterium]|jgi:metal-responsive CopG/Arc/MetJ family transcriptional regulator|nr:hypothetical protein [Chitinispirillales bacterium]